MTDLKLTFVLNGETKRTFKFAETDARGKILEMTDAKIGMVYLKKDVFNGSAPPTQLTVSVAGR